MPLHRAAAALSATAAGFATAHASANLFFHSFSDAGESEASTPSGSEKKSWLQRMLLSDTDLKSFSPSATSAIDNIMQKLKPRENKPGKVLVWGGIFGRSPIHIDTLSDRVTCAVAGFNGMGAAVEDSGKAVVFGFDPKHHQHVNADPVPVPLNARAASVTWRDAHDQALFLDKSGLLYLVQVSQDEKSKLVSCDTNNNGSSSSSTSYVKPMEIVVKQKGSVKGLKKKERFQKISCANSNCIALSKAGVPYFFKSVENSSGNENEFEIFDLSQANNGSGESDHEIETEDSMKGKKFTDVACSDDHLVLLSDKGEIFTSGNDQWIQLGQEARPWTGYKSSNDTSNKTDKVKKARLFHSNDDETYQIKGSKVIAGRYHSGLLNQDGILYTCGFNQFGQLGHHNYTTFAPPCPVSNVNLKVSNCSTGLYHTCIIDFITFNMKCIGGNEFGQLGNGTLQNSSVWKNVKYNGKNIKPYFIYTGNFTSVAIIE